MKIKCFFGKHKWSGWEEIKNHLDRECFRCGKRGKVQKIHQVRPLRLTR